VQRWIQPRQKFTVARLAEHAETDLAAYRLHPAHEVVGLAGILHRHEIGQLGHAVVGERASEEDVGVGQIELPARRLTELRGDLEAAAALGVEECREHRRRIEGGQAEEVDRAVLAHQRRRVEVADDAVVLDGRIATCHGPDSSCVFIVTHGNVPALRRSGGLS
jgi:hypothetical protein